MASPFSSSPLSLPISLQQKHEIQEKYDVFLSFRGEDTRYKFVSHLYAALSAKHISTFMDDHELQVGDEISSTLRKAIQNSEIGIIIFSKNYASSTWCLNELVEILECKKRNKMSVVIPIFYEIDASDVRKQKESYEIAFAELEKRFKDRTEKVYQWRAALTEASNLTGLDSMKFRGESEFVRKIVENILERLLQCGSLDEQYFKGTVGMEKNMKEIESLLEIGRESLLEIGRERIPCIGIWGMGGIGKTTLAKVVFQKLSSSQLFDSCCFLEDVRKIHKAPSGLDHLIKKVISRLLKDETIQKMDIHVEALSPTIFHRLQRTKALVVLDDVDNPTQFEAFTNGFCILAPGSRIIVTSRDEQVLKKATDRIHKVKSLNDDDSLELFRLLAFRENSPPIDHIMVLEAMRHAHGNPLALKILASSLCGRPRDEWDSVLEKLKRNQNLEIKDVLKISYDGLDNGSKDTFLDIAFIYNSSFTKDHAKSILGDTVGIEITFLIQKCLIENGERNELLMHDLLRQMAQEIVHDEDKKEPGNRSRLSDAMEVCDVLENRTGTAAVEVISLNIFEVKKNVRMHHEAFSNMRNLRLLRVYYGHDYTARNEWIHEFQLSIPEAQALHPYLSTKLRFLQWDSYPLKSLPSEFNPENLVELVLRGSNVEKLWNSHKIVSLPVLRRMDLSFSKLTQVPDLRRAPNLEEINLEGCTSLAWFCSSFQNLENLRCLNLGGCCKLRDVEGMFKRTEEFSESWIQKFISSVWPYPSQAHISQKLAPNLSFLNLSNTAIETVPQSIGYMSGLVVLNLGFCKSLRSLPTSICHLEFLESLYLSGCKKLKALPEILEPMVRLKKLFLTNSGIKKLPESIENLVSLHSLYMDECKDLEFLPGSLGRLRGLRMMTLRYCSRIQELPPFLPSLHNLSVNYCLRLKSLPEIPSQSLKVSACGCTSLENISNIRSVQPFHTMDTLNNPWSVYFSFYGCGKLEQNARNILADHALFHILSRLKLGFGYTAGGCRSDYFCYPGNEIPEWFNHQTRGTSITKIRPRPYWNDPNFLSVAFCIVLHQNTIISGARLAFEWKSNSKTMDFVYTVQDVSADKVKHREVSSDNVFIGHVTKPIAQKKMDKLDWPDTWFTDVSFHASLRNYGDASLKIKKFGVRLIYKQDLKSLNEKLKEGIRKNKRRFHESCESSGSVAVDSLEEENDDEAHFKKNSKLWDCLQGIEEFVCTLCGHRGT